MLETQRRLGTKIARAIVPLSAVEEMFALVLAKVKVVIVGTAVIA
jgi:hypothetical protein